MWNPFSETSFVAAPQVYQLRGQPQDVRQFWRILAEAESDITNRKIIKEVQKLEGIDKVTMKVGDGAEVDITKGLDEISKMVKIIVEAKGQLCHLLDSHAEAIYGAMKSQDNKIKIGLSVSLECTSQKCFVVTDINYTVLKVKDGLDGEITFNQEMLPGVDA
jgi:hypothetical protein